MTKESNSKLIVVLGPTACGKTKIAIRLAHKFNGEIISADSRQVYRGMDIGTGKDLADYRIKLSGGQNNQRSRFSGVPYHLIDVVRPMTSFNVARYQKMANRAIADVFKRQRQPFLVGGTGLYIDAVTQGFVFGQDKKNNSHSVDFRKKFSRLSLDDLLVKLKKIDPVTYNIIDKKNRRRVERAVEIYCQTGKPKSLQPESQKPPYDILFIGIKYPLDKIYQKIDRRLEVRIKQGMIAEIKTLRRQGVSWKRLDEFGLEYRFVSRYLRGELEYEVMVDQLKLAIHHFAKRQITWFKRNQKVVWVESYAQATQAVKKFLSR